MAYTFPVATAGMIFQVLLRMDMNNQRLLNSYHFRLVQNTSGLTVEGVADQMNIWFNTVGTGLYDTHGALRDTACTLLDAQIQVISPERYVGKGYVLNKPGQVTGTAGVETPNVAAVLTRRAVTATRRGVSSLHIPLGIAPETIVQGELSAAAKTDVGDHGNAILNATNIGIGVVLEPIVYHRGQIPLYDALGSFIVQSEVRVMRRRTVRVGI